MPHFSLTSALTGITPAAILHLIKQDEPNTLQLGMAISIEQIITSIILVPYFLQILFGLPLCESRDERRFPASRDR
ncbi:MAG: hypothetical protein MUP69_02195 [Candidatus Atribacteria bacterium]|nr:hypothetical protein [Candidatus Atribacteria bacterium]